MTRHEKIIQLNDELRKTFRDGRVQMTSAVYNLDPQLRGRALWAMARYNRFADETNTRANPAPAKEHQPEAIRATGTRFR